VADIVDQATRSQMMSGIRSRNTKPERIIRSGLHRRGFRFSLHNRRLRGTPDLALPKHGALIFVHGCFWHGHDCHFFKMPSTRPEFWKAKFARNQANDASARATLLEDGWRILTIWECAVRDRPEKDVAALLDRIGAWLKSTRRTLELRGPRRRAA
jgi:DNA mismatch endonuclease (patch repair protein)